MVTAKVVCNSKQENGQGENRVVKVRFTADYADDRNKEWAVNTPSLSLEMDLKGDVADRFEPGSRFLLTFQPEE